MSTIIVPRSLGQPLNLGFWPTKNLVFYWRGIYADKVIDESLNRNDGTITGPTWVGDGLYFDGDGDRVTTAVAGIFNADEGTLIIQVRHATANHSGDYLWDTFGGSSRRFLLFFEPGNSLRLYTDGGNRGVVDTTGTYTDGGVSTYALVWGVNDLYIDGKLFHTFTAGGLGAGSSTLYIGDRYVNADQSFLGTIKDVKVYNRGLSASEIAALYINPNIPMQQDPTPFWSFVSAPVGANPVGPLGHPFHGPFGGPVAA